MIKVDILMIKNKPVDSIGHNALASVIYFGTFWAFLLQSITGFGLYAKMSESIFPQLFAWTVPLMGGDLVAREIHHFLMWFFILFAIVHIYLVFYHDYIEQRGETSSIIGQIRRIGGECGHGSRYTGVRLRRRLAGGEQPSGLPGGVYPQRRALRHEPQCPQDGDLPHRGRLRRVKIW